ncbi:hypothetical protein KHP62_03055 [Rhodobacteraceae bacterium NNCM2]|nr:hypothetical protein [Coraliihabitans acroporae]
MTDDNNRNRDADRGEPPVTGGDAPDNQSEHEARMARRAARRKRLAAAEAGAEAESNLLPGPGEGEAPPHTEAPDRQGQAPVPVGRRRQPGQKKRSALPALRKEMQPDTPALRAERVEAIRRDLVKRRRRKGAGMLARLFFFVLVPTMVVAWFLWERATPFYESVSTFTVQSADGGVTGSGGGLLSKFMGARTGGNDPVAVQSFIMSRDVLERLNEDFDFNAHYQNPNFDFWNRLKPDATLEQAFDYYQRVVNVSFDPSEGVLEMTVRAATPVDAQLFSEAIIGYAEQMVDRLSDPIRQATLRDAEQSLEDAEARLKEAQETQAELREQLNIFSVEVEVTKEMEIISALEIELESLSGKLTNLRKVTSESDPRVERLASQVETLQAQIAARQEKLTGAQLTGNSLADTNVALQSANFEVTAAMTLFSSAIESYELAKLDAARQHRYLAMIVKPSLPDAPGYPKKFQTTALAFLIFLGGYVLLSLTFSLIREQASI